MDCQVKARQIGDLPVISSLPVAGIAASWLARLAKSMSSRLIRDPASEGKVERH